MRLTIRDNKDQVGNYIADYIVHRINKFVPTPEHPNFVLGLPTGSSPLPVYQRLVKLYKEGKVSFKVSFPRARPAPPLTEWSFGSVDHGSGRASGRGPPEECRR